MAGRLAAWPRLDEDVHRTLPRVISNAFAVVSIRPVVGLTMARTTQRIKASSACLPETGFIRDKALCEHLTIGRSTLWRWVKNCKVPAPIKLANRTTVWNVEKVRAWIEARHGAK
jgi:prophage regulatory protein